MALRDFLLKYLDDNRINMFDKDQFTQHNRNFARTLYMGGSILAADVASNSDNPTSKVLIKRFTICAENTFKALFKNQQEVLGNCIVKYFGRECQVWNNSDANHPNIMKFYGMVEQEGDELPAFVTQIVNSGDLFSLIADNPPLPLGTKLKLMCDIAKGLSFLHERRTIHRALKSCNVMLDRQPDGTLVALLGDLGSTEDFMEVVDFDKNQTEYLNGYPQTIAYSSPEQIQSRHHFDEATDIWSFGCTILEILGWSGRIWPMSDSNTNVPYFCTVHESLKLGDHPPRPTGIPETDSIWTFIETRCFCKNPSDRVTASQACVELEQLL